MKQNKELVKIDDIENHKMKGNQLIGRKIKKAFDTDTGVGWYEGTITTYFPGPNGPFYTIEYIDNTTEELFENTVLGYLRC
jgi:hypothetical protein